jgi:putative tryptophan/tyrosine transport system substrate-binding protein
MRRREFITLLGGAAAAWPLAARAQQAAMPVVGYLPRAAPIRNDFGKFLDGLRALGYEEGRNIRIERHYGNSDDKRLRELAQELARLNPVVIVVDGPVTIGMVQAATTTIPIVSAIMGDPELFGIAQLNRPGGNLTGLTTLGDVLFAKRVELLKEMLPQIQTIAVLRSLPNLKPAATQVTSEAAKALGLTVRIYDAGERSTWPSMFAAMVDDKCDALLQFTDGKFAAVTTALVVLAVARHLPAMYGEREFVDAGGLASYGVSLGDQFRRAAAYVDKIIKGAKPGDLPVEQPTKFELVINANTAKALGLEVPPTLLARADEVIE